MDSLRSLAMSGGFSTNRNNRASDAEQRESISDQIREANSPKAQERRQAQMDLLKARASYDVAVLQARNEAPQSTPGFGGMQVQSTSQSTSNESQIPIIEGQIALEAAKNRLQLLNR